MIPYVLTLAAVAAASLYVLLPQCLKAIRGLPWWDTPEEKRIRSLKSLSDDDWNVRR